MDEAQQATHLLPVVSATADECHRQATTISVTITRGDEQAPPNGGEGLITYCRQGLVNLISVPSKSSLTTFSGRHIRARQRLGAGRSSGGRSPICSLRDTCDIREGE